MFRFTKKLEHKLYTTRICWKYDRFCDRFFRLQKNGFATNFATDLSKMGLN